ncbi:MAG: methionine--tRNA ligase subunit beta, partial [Lachnospiraceae bacterium]|nr:methionine--tRNA ligase subunit beta [Lachnospiraceae bacterium]
ADDLVNLFGVDAVRYFVVHEMPYENDGVITWELMIERTNSDLANTLGNLVNRTAAMSNKYFGGGIRDGGVSEPVDGDLKAAVLAVPDKVEALMEGLHVADALTEIWSIFKRCNKYIDETMPWALAKDETKKDRLATVLYNLAESLSIGAALLKPFLPGTAEKILKQLGLPERGFETLGSFGLTREARAAEKPEILFARLDPAAVMKKVAETFPEKTEETKAETKEVKAPAEEKKETAEETKAPITHKAEIEYDDFAKMEFRIGEIVKCEEVPKSKKLLVSQVKFGTETRQIVSGIKAWYKPEQMVGKKVMAVVNLKPAKLAGLLSEGMILAAEDEEGRLALMTPDGEIAAGAEVR